MLPKLVLLIAAIAASVQSIPIGDVLQRPSPINPDIPMEPKPAETITVITDPKEIAKYKRAISEGETTASTRITAPTTVAPLASNSGKSSNHRQKRETKTTTPTQPKPLQKPNIQKPSSEPVATSSASTTTVKHRTKRDEKDIAPLIDRNQHKQPISTLQHDDQPTTHNKPQTFPAILTAKEPQSKPFKRDIPVPLVPKYHHPEESSNDDSDDNEHLGEHNLPTKTKKTSEKKTNSIHQHHDHPDEVQVEDLSEPKPIHHTTEPPHRHQQPQHYDQHSTEPSIYRHQPVPVAELFAKAKTTATPAPAADQDEN